MVVLKGEGVEGDGGHAHLIGELWDVDLARLIKRIFKEVRIDADVICNRIAVDGRYTGREVGGTFSSLEGLLVRYYHRST